MADPTRSPLRRKLMNVKVLQAAVLLPPMSSHADSSSAGMGIGSGPGWLSLRRIVDIPFETCVAALEAGRARDTTVNCKSARARCAARSSMIAARVHAGVEVRLARGPLHAQLRTRLNIDCWSRPSSTALELIPCGRVRATASYFRTGHLLLDLLTHSLQL
jgi:hypothetical protein